MNVPPGPKGLPIIGNLEAFEQDRLGFLTECKNLYGDIVRYHSSTYIVFHPDHIATILKRTNREFGIGFDVFQRGIDDEHTKDFMAYRHTVVQGMTHSLLRSFLPKMLDIVDAKTASWSPGMTVDVPKAMEEITGACINQYCFGEESEGMSELTRDMLNALVPRIGNPVLLPLWLPAPSSIRVRRNKKLFFTAITERFERRDRVSKQECLVDHLLETYRHRTGAPRERLVQALGATIMAGYRVPAAALSWTLLLALKDTETIKTIRAESELHIHQGSTENLLNLNFTQNVIKEALRLYPPTWLIDRRVEKAFKIGDYEVRPGQEVMFSPYITHRDPRFYKEPDRFIPERWDDSEANRQRHTFAYLPFGGGPRTCIGQNISWVILTVVAAALISKFDLEIIDKDVIPNPKNTLLPSNLNMLIQSRRLGSFAIPATETATPKCPFHASF